jgi:hypothetical protein
MFAQLVLGYRYETLKHNPCARPEELGKPFENRILSRTTGIHCSVWRDELTDKNGLFSGIIGHLGKRLPNWKDGLQSSRMRWNQAHSFRHSVSRTADSSSQSLHFPTLRTTMSFHARVIKRAPSDLMSASLKSIELTHLSMCSVAPKLRATRITPLCHCTLKSTETWVFSQASLSTPVSAPTPSREIVSCSIGLLSDSSFMSMRAKSSF